ncbi:MAG: hypothetical protein EBS34_11505 [Flavobacteriales bacterium]|nr:hypothetical protein [Flavobacteriales bacterium]
MANLPIVKKLQFFARYREGKFLQIAVIQLTFCSSSLSILSPMPCLRAVSPTIHVAFNTPNILLANNKPTTIFPFFAIMMKLDFLRLIALLSHKASFGMMDNTNSLQSISKND